MDYALTESGMAPRNFVIFDGPKVAATKSQMVGSAGLALRRHVIFYGTSVAAAKSPMVGPSGAGGLALRRHVVVLGGPSVIVPVKSAAVVEVAAAVDTRSAAARRRTLVVAEVAASTDAQSVAVTAVTPAVEVEFVKAMEDLFILWRKMHP